MGRSHPSRLSWSPRSGPPAALRISTERKPAASPPRRHRSRAARAGEGATVGGLWADPRPAQARPRPGRVPAPIRIAPASPPAKPVPAAQSRRAASRVRAAMAAAGELQADRKTRAAAACAPGKGTGARKGSWAPRAGSGPAGRPHAPRTPPASASEHARTGAHAQNWGARAAASSRRRRSRRPRGAWEPCVRSLASAGGAPCAAGGRLREVQFPLNLKMR